MLDTYKYYYSTQRDSGQYSKMNCGPACASMAIKFHKGQEVSTSNLRDLIQSWTFWTDSKIHQALERFSTKYSYQSCRNLADLKHAVSPKNSIAIINVNMKDIPRGKGVNKPYSTWTLFGLPIWNHYLVVVSMADDGLVYVLDPYTGDGNPRPYSAWSIMEAMRARNTNITVINNVK